MTRDKVLRNYLNSRIETCKNRGDVMFLGLPREWYECNVKYCCENAHLSRQYFKSEQFGNVCFHCFRPVFIAPPDFTEEILIRILNSKWEKGNGTYSYFVKW